MFVYCNIVTVRVLSFHITEYPRDSSSGRAWAYVLSFRISAGMWVVLPFISNFMVSSSGSGDSEDFNCRIISSYWCLLSADNGKARRAVEGTPGLIMWFCEIVSI